MSGDYEIDDGVVANARNPSNRPRKSGLRRLGGFLNTIFTMAVFASLVLGATILYGKVRFEEVGPLKKDTSFVVRNGQGVTGIANALEKKGIISDARVFVAAALITDSKGSLKAGEYRLPANVSMQEIMDTLVSGKSVQHKITVPEGFTSLQVVERVNQHEALVGEVTLIPAEGSLLPDTYIFLRDVSRQDILDRMRKAQQKALEELWQNRAENLPIASPEEALILASIVEKETGQSSERALVAGVFTNRLRKKIRLQSDPTIIYGIVGGKGVLDRPIRKSDIAKKTKYNTYQINGLPPTPIANPGIEAIKAVLNPAKTKSLYFVADGTGGHVFASTLRQHKANVANWRKVESARRRAKKKAQQEEKARKLAAAQAPAVKIETSPPPPPPAPPAADSAAENKTANVVESSVKRDASLTTPAAAATAEVSGTLKGSVEDETVPATKVALTSQGVDAEEDAEQKQKSRLGERIVPKPRPKPTRPAASLATNPDPPGIDGSLEAGSVEQSIDAETIAPPPVKKKRRKRRKNITNSKTANPDDNGR